MKNTDKINFGVILRVLVALLPIFFGMPTLAMVFCAYVIAMYFLTCGPLTFIAGSLSAIVISMFLFNGISEAAQIDGLFLAVEAILCAVACAITIMKKKSFFSGVYMASLAYFVPSFINTGRQASEMGMSVAEFLTDIPMQMVKMQFEELSESIGAEIALITDVMNKLSEIIVMMVPSVLVVSSVIIGYIMMWIIAFPFRKNEMYTHYSFAEIKFPRIAFFIMLLAGASWLIVPDELKYISLNVVFILSSFSFFAGMSLVDFFMRKKIRNIFGRLAIHMALYTFSMPVASVSPFVNVLTIYTVLGIIDSFVNIRKRISKAPSEELEGI